MTSASPRNKAIVTGGAGFIGSNLVRHLLHNDWQVLVVDKLTYAGHLSSLSDVRHLSHFEFSHGDICRQDYIAALIMDFSPSVIFHLAAESHVDRSIDGAGIFIESNILGTYSMLCGARAYWDQCPAELRDHFRFIHVSTDEVFGSLGEYGYFNEHSPYAPRSPYSASKAASDHLVAAWTHTYGLPAIITHCSNNYGPYHLPEKLIPLMILNALEGMSLPVYGDGQNVRDWLYVADHARALQMIADAGRIGQTYNIGGRNERTNLEVVTTICDLLDRMISVSKPRRDLIQFVPDRPGHDRRYAVDAAKLETEIGWRSVESFESGIEKTVRWYLDNSWWWQPLRALAAERRGLA